MTSNARSDINQAPTGSVSEILRGNERLGSASAYFFGRWVAVMTLGSEMIELGRRARAAARALLQVSGEDRSRALTRMADALEDGADGILKANQQDLNAADERGIVGAMRDRLALSPARIAGMARGLREVAAMDDPLGAVVSEWTRPNGLEISQVRIPLGVIGIIYEARPNVTADAAGLCLKSGNVVFLRGQRGAAQQCCDHGVPARCD